MKIIKILGCGWLGTAIAQSLISEYTCIVSVRTEEKKKRLEALGLQVKLVTVEENEIVDTTSFFSPADVLIISLTPIGIPYFQQVIRAIEKNGIQKVILFSSTGIYSDCEGWVDEESPLHIQNPKVKHLKEIEDLFLHNSHFDCTILRLGGLIGTNRNPVKYLSTKNFIDKGNEPVNIVSDKEIIEIIHALLQHTIGNTIFNIVSDDHRSKEDFYKEEAATYGIDLPPFEYSEKLKNRKVSNQKIKTYLKKK